MPSYFSAVHLIGLKTESQFWGNNSPTELFLLQGEGDRQWIEAHYPGGSGFDCANGFLMPEQPGDQNILLDSCMLFMADVFKEIPDFKILEKFVAEKKIDLELDKPKEWDLLRRECLPYMGRLTIKTLTIDRNDIE